MITEQEWEMKRKEKIRELDLILFDTVWKLNDHVVSHKRFA